MEAKDTNMSTVDESYPPDPNDGDGGKDMSGPGNVPPLRSAGVRAQAKAAMRQKPAKQPKSLGKKQGATRILAQQKRRQALEARKAGMTYQQIAEAVGYTDGSAARKAVLKAMGDIIQEPARELKIIQIERYNQMLLALWNKVSAGDELSINTAIPVMQRIDILEGTEAAQQVHVQSQVTNQHAVLVVEGDKDDYIAAMRKMVGFGIQQDGTNGAKELPSPTTPSSGQGQFNYPPGMTPQPVDSPVDELDVVEGEIVEDDMLPIFGTEAQDTSPPEPVRTGRKFNFGMDPTVKRGDK